MSVTSPRKCIAFYQQEFPYEWQDLTDCKLLDSLCASLTGSLPVYGIPCPS